MHPRIQLWGVAIICSLFASFQTIEAQGTAFTYQGRFNDGTNPASGVYDLTFALFNSAGGSGQVGSTIATNAVHMTNGYFVVTLDFGANFDGSGRWLEISARTNGGGAFTKLAPRQTLTSVPYAVTANGISGSLSVSNLNGGAGAGSTAFWRGDGIWSTALQPVNNLADLSSAAVARANLGLNTNYYTLNNDPRPLNWTNQGNTIGGTLSGNVIGGNLSGNAGGGRITNLSATIFNVRDYGARGDGGDDSAAIKAAFTAWENNTFGGVLYFPAGVYLDTNTYSIDGTHWQLQDTRFPDSIRGDGIASTYWKASITNAIFLTVGLGCQPDMGDITIWDDGAGTNTGIHFPFGYNYMRWQNVRFHGFKHIGASVQALAGATITMCQFDACGTGLRVAGYCDGMSGDMRIDNNTVAGLEIGVPTTLFFTNALGQPDTGVHASSWRVTGANNQIAVIIGNGTGTRISGYIENSTNCTVAIGHPDGSDGNQPRSIQPTEIDNMGGLFTGSQVFVRVYSPCSSLFLHNLEGYPTNVVCATPYADTLTPMVFEGVDRSLTYVVFSDGTSIPSDNLDGLNKRFTLNQGASGWVKVSGQAPSEYFYNGLTNFTFGTNGNFSVAGNIYPQGTYSMSRTAVSPAPGATYAANLGIRFHDVTVTSSVNVAVSNTGLLTATNVIVTDLFFFPGTLSQGVTFPTNWVWESESGLATAPTTIPASKMLHVTLTSEGGTATNFVASARLAPYTPH